MKKSITLFVLALLILQFNSPRLFGQYPGSGQVSINPASIPQFVDPLPHFAGLRINVKNGGNLIIDARPCQQVAVSTGTVLENGTVGITPNAGLAHFWGYRISKDNGNSWMPAHWPAFSIEASRNHPLHVTMRNGLYGQTYQDVNIAVDQSIMWAAPTVTGDPMVDPYTGPVPVCIHLHGGEVQSYSDGGPNSWFTPGYALKGSEFQQGVDSVYYYPNSQEAATIWFHEHVMGATRCNVYAGLAGFYFLRGPDEEADRLPGWSGDDLVKEVAPVGTSGTFNPNPYLPEIEIAIQDRMFDTKGQLYWPVNPPNPLLHPLWTPEFFGDVITVNGKTWPYLSVAPRKYRFHILDGSNARFYKLCLKNLVTGFNYPGMIQVGTDGGLLQNPAYFANTANDMLFIAPGERVDMVIDFSRCAPGTVLTLMNNCAAPFPTGDPVTVGTTDRIMQFVVNGRMVSAQNINNPGTDKSQVPATLRATPMVKLTNFNGSPTVTPKVIRQLTLNEIEGPGGPEIILVNNSRFDNMGGPGQFGDITEKPVEGTTEMWQIINTTMDAHPMHMHLVQFQLVSRQAYDPAWLNVYNAAFPGGALIPGGGPPRSYNVQNSDHAVGGNPSITPYLTGPVKGADPNEKGWKDTYKSYPGEVMTYMVRFAPTDMPTNYPPQWLKFGFDPSKGPGYVWHCHIVDHEDNEMMRRFTVVPSPYRTFTEPGSVVSENSAAPQISMPEGYSLGQNTPNPFVSQTEIGFTLPEATHVTLTLINQTGVTVSKLIDSDAPAGTHLVKLDASTLSGGIYFYQMKAGSFADVKKLVVIK